MGSSSLWTLLFLLLCALVGQAIGQNKGRKELGFALGFFLGFIGWIIIALLPPDYKAMNKKQCPYCREWIDADASVCPHCHHELEVLS